MSGACGWRRSTRWAAMVVAVAVFSLMSRPVLAQTDTGSIAGLVTDGTGAAVPGVTIAVTNLSTGQARTVVTNEQGRYQVAALQPSRYSIKTELQGFANVVRPDVTVNVGTAVDVNFTLKLASLEETVTVTGEAPLIESTKAELSNVINQQQLESLPSKSRQYLDFTLLLPATVDSVSINMQGAGFSLGGARSSQAALLVDGFYNMDEGFVLPKQRYSQDAIQEFQVISFGGSAEYGRAIGGIVNGITKSGGNSFHGSGYGFYRNTDLNAEEVGSRLRGVPKGPYNRQQWGGTLGGPIVHDRSFFFGSYERVKEDYTFDNGITAANAAVIGLPPKDVGQIPRYYRLNFAMGRWDYNISDSSRIQASFAMSRWTEFNISSLVTFGATSRQYNLKATDWSYLFKWTKVAGGGHALHELKVSYFPRFYGVSGLNQGGPPLVPEGQINPPGVHESNASPPSVSITSVASFGSVAINNKINTYPVAAIYTSTLFTKQHSVKFGVDYMNAYYDYTLYSSLRGSYSFSSLANFVAGRYTSFTQSFGDPHNPRRHHYLSGFVQDSWQVSNWLTLNYGLRYDLEIHPMSPAGKRFGYDYRDFGPRFAASYDLTGKGTTFLKFASGLYYDRVMQNLTTFYTNIKGYQRLQSATWTPTSPGAPIYPNVFTSKPADLPRSVVNTNILPDKWKTAASGQLTGTVEHALTPNLVVSASAVYTHAWNNSYSWDTNLAWNDTTQTWIRPDPNYRAISQYRVGAWADYVGGIFEIKRRGTRFGLNGSVTINRARNTGSNYGSSANDQRVGIAAEYGPQSDTPAVRGVVSGWYNFTPNMQVSGVFQARSGMAVNPTASGLDLNGDGNFGDRTPTFGRNSFRGPSFNTADLRFTWRLPVQENKVSLYVESFNIVNRVNVTTVDGNYGPTPGQPLPNFLAPLTYYPPRQVQIGARVTF